MSVAPNSLFFQAHGLLNKDKAALRTFNQDNKDNTLKAWLKFILAELTIILEELEKTASCHKELLEQEYLPHFNNMLEQINTYITDPSPTNLQALQNTLTDSGSVLAHLSANHNLSRMDGGYYAHPTMLNPTISYLLVFAGAVLLMTSLLIGMSVATPALRDAALAGIIAGGILLFTAMSTYKTDIAPGEPTLQSTSDSASSLALPRRGSPFAFFLDTETQRSDSHLILADKWMRELQREVTNWQDHPAQTPPAAQLFGLSLSYSP